MEKYNMLDTMDRLYIEYTSLKDDDTNEFIKAFRFDTIIPITKNDLLGIFNRLAWSLAPIEYTISVDTRKDLYTNPIELDAINYCNYEQIILQDNAIKIAKHSGIDNNLGLEKSITISVISGISTITFNNIMNHSTDMAMIHINSADIDILDGDSTTFHGVDIDIMYNKDASYDKNITIGFESSRKEEEK